MPSSTPQAGQHDGLTQRHIVPRRHKRVPKPPTPLMKLLEMSLGHTARLWAPTRAKGVRGDRWTACFPIAFSLHALFPRRRFVPQAPGGRRQAGAYFLALDYSPPEKSAGVFLFTSRIMHSFGSPVDHRSCGSFQS
jgi:hypothetical protein